MTIGKYEYYAQARYFPRLKLGFSIKNSVGRSQWKHINLWKIQIQIYRYFKELL